MQLSTSAQHAEPPAAENPASRSVKLAEVAASQAAAPRPVVLSLEELPGVVPSSSGQGLAGSGQPQHADPSARSAAAESASKDSLDSVRERSTSVGSMLCHDAAGAALPVIPSQACQDILAWLLRTWLLCAWPQSSCMRPASCAACVYVCMQAQQSS